MSQLHRSLTVLAAWLSLGGSLALAQPFVAHVTPPVVARGQTVRLHFHGTHLSRALALWTTLPTGSVTTKPAGPTALDVTVAPEAPVGVFGARLATSDGLSNLVLLHLEDLPVRHLASRSATEVPPSSASLAWWGTFRQAEVERVAVDVAAGQQLSFEAVANRLGKDFDPVVLIRDAAGRLVAECDNSPGLFFDCRFRHQFERAGRYTVEVHERRYRGGAEGHFVLRIGQFPPARVAVPAVVTADSATARLPEAQDTTVTLTLPPRQPPGLANASVRRSGDTASTAIPVRVADGALTVFEPPTPSTLPDEVVPLVNAASFVGFNSGFPHGARWLAAEFAVRRDHGTVARFPGSLCGVLREPGRSHRFWLMLQRGQRLRLLGEARTLNSPVELEMELTDESGRVLARAADNDQETPPEIVFSVPQDSAYGVVIRDQARDAGPAYAYCIDVRPVLPSVQVTAEVEGLTVPQGTYQPIPLTITRKDYVGPVRLELEGAPPGVTLEPTEIAEKETALVARLSAAPTAPLGVATLRILARPVLHYDGDAVALALGRRLPKSFTEPRLPRFAATHRPLVDRQLHNVDLIPIGLREDQRRLPPGVSERFALQITPPAPFDFTLPEALVPLIRYAHVAFPIVTKRSPGFTGPIHFEARGGQLAPKDEGRTRVYAELPAAPPDQSTVHGAIHTRILVNLQKHRVDVTGVGEHAGRKVFLTRTFDLEVKTGFELAVEPRELQLLPGESGTARLNVVRRAPFDGPVTVELQNPVMGLPAKVTIPAGQAGIDLPVTVPADATPTRINIPLHATGQVVQYEEETRGGPLTIEVRKPPEPAKK